MGVLPAGLLLAPPWGPESRGTLRAGGRSWGVPLGAAALMRTGGRKGQARAQAPRSGGRRPKPGEGARSVRVPRLGAWARCRIAHSDAPRRKLRDGSEKRAGAAGQKRTVGPFRNTFHLKSSLSYVNRRFTLHRCETHRVVEPMRCRVRDCRCGSRGVRERQHSKRLLTEGRIGRLRLYVLGHRR